MTAKEKLTGLQMLVVPSGKGSPINEKRDTLLVPNDWWMAKGDILLPIPPDIFFGVDDRTGTLQEGIRLFGDRSCSVQRFVRAVKFERVRERANINCLAVSCVWISAVPFGVCINTIVNGSVDFSFLLPCQIHKCQPGQEIPIPEATMPASCRCGEKGWVNLVHLAKAIGLTPLETLKSFLHSRAVSKGETSYVYAPTQDDLGMGEFERSPKIIGEGLLAATGFAGRSGVGREEPKIERDPSCVWVTLKAAEMVLRLHLLGLKTAKDALSF